MFILNTNTAFFAEQTYGQSDRQTDGRGKPKTIIYGPRLYETGVALRQTKLHPVALHWQKKCVSQAPVPNPTITRYKFV